jgi:protein-disulfide isomerase
MHFVIRLTALLMLLLTASLAAATDLENLSDGERAALRAEIRSYLLDNPEIIVEVIGLLEQRRAEAEAQAALTLVPDNAEAIFNDGFSYVGNNPDGDVTMVEFLDYRCPFCKKAHKEVQALLKADPGLRYIVKEYPILGPDSILATRAAISVLMSQGNEAYKGFNDAVMRFNGPINMVTLGRIARKLDIDEAKMVELMDTKEVTDRIAMTMALASRLNIGGTPSFVIGNEIYAGYMTFDQMQEAVNSVRLAQE